MPMTYDEAFEFFKEFHRGEWHFPYPIKKCGGGWSMLCFSNDNLSTYDDDSLTRLVFMAHRDAYRLHIESAGNKMKIVIYKRVRDPEERYYRRHPSIMEALKKWWKCG